MSPLICCICSKNEKNGTENQNSTDKRFYGPANSCVEISKLGYTLNGYYLVKGKNQIKNDQIEVLGCRFKHPDGSKEGIVINYTQYNIVKGIEIIFSQRRKNRIHRY